MLNLIVRRLRRCLYLFPGDLSNSLQSYCSVNVRYAIVQSFNLKGNEFHSKFTHVSNNQDLKHCIYNIIVTRLQITPVEY